jgi:hypothetical protein
MRIRGVLFYCSGNRDDFPKQFSPRGEPYATAYWLAPEAGAAAEAAASEAAAPASEAAAVAEAAASLAAAAASEAAAPASEAAAAGAEAAAASLAGAAAWSLLLLHAASATAANRDATRRDFFMITSFYGLKVSNSAK